MIYAVTTEISNVLDTFDYLGFYSFGMHTFFSLCLRAFTDIFFLGVICLWIYWFWKDMPSLKIPVIVTFAYCVYKLIRFFTDYFSGSLYTSLFDKLKYDWTLFVIIIAWTVLLIGTDYVNRIIFVVVRGIILLYSFVSGAKAIWYYLESIFSYGSLFNKIEFGYNIMLIILWRALLVLFLLYIAKPELFYKKEMQYNNNYYYQPYQPMN